MDTLHIGLDPWILSDGNYEDFKVGQHRKFALEFYGPDLQPYKTSSEPSLTWIDSAKYSAIGRVVFVDPTVWVCDFDRVLAYAEDPPPWAAVGVCLSGEVYLGIDHYSYFEFHHQLPGMPALTSEFSVHRIIVETIPLIYHPEQNRYTLSDTGRTYREVEDTRRDPLRDPFDKTNTTDFILECEMLESGLSAIKSRDE